MLITVYCLICESMVRLFFELVTFRMGNFNWKLLSQTQLTKPDEYFFSFTRESLNSFHVKLGLFLGNENDNCMSVGL